MFEQGSRRSDAYRSHYYALHVKTSIASLVFRGSLHTHDCGAAYISNCLFMASDKYIQCDIFSAERPLIWTTTFRNIVIFCM